MMKRPLAFILCLTCFFTACTKTSDSNVSIKIENNTTQDFKEVFINNESFTDIKASTVTSYKIFDTVIALPWARLITTNSDTAFAGALYTDPPVSYLPGGRYTLQIFEDTSSYYGYNCKYIKD